MRYVTFFSSCLLAAALLCAIPARGQSGTNYTVTKSVVAGGAGATSSGSYDVTGTAGQPAVGTSSGGTYTVQAGFWARAADGGDGGPAADVTLSIPTGLQGVVGDSATISVQVSDLSGLDVTSFRLEIDYDASLLEVTGVTKGDVLGESTILAVNTNDAGQVVIGAADSTALSGSGTLLNLEVDYKAAGSFTLSFAEAVMNEGNVATQTQDGSGTITDILYGDADGNGSVTPNDAALVLRYSVGLEQLQGSALVAAEVSGNGDILPYDASLILRYYVDKITCFPVESGCQTSGKRTLVATGRLAWGAPQPAQGGDVIDVPLVLFEGQGVRSLSVEAAVDASAYAVEEVTSPLGEEAMLVHRVAGDTLRLAVASAEAFGGEVAVVRLRRLGTEAPPALAGTWRVNEAPEQALAAAEADAPTDYALAQNYPNPFNPETTIRYELPEAAEVRLEVFDVLGREVAVLVDEEKRAGRHEVRFDARELPSGAYFYRIEAGDFTETHEMMLVK